MKRNLLKIVSGAGLILTLLPSFFVFFDMMELAYAHSLMILGTLLWFISVPFWINKEIVRENHD
jgi:hypothetical protein